MDNYEKAARPSSISPFPDRRGYEVRRGERHDLVTVIQIMLCALKLYYDTLGAVNVGGVFDLQTEKAVTAFQKINGIPMTGRVDVTTWNRLAGEFNAAVGENQ